MELCADIDFEKEHKECEYALLVMDIGSYNNGEYYYTQEEKECINDNNNVTNYIHCERIYIESMDP